MTEHDEGLWPMNEHEWLARQFEVNRSHLRSAAYRLGAAPGPDADLSRRREIVDAFLVASRGGDFDALLAVLDPDVVLRADHVAVQAGALTEVRGAASVAGIVSGRARDARPALVNGTAGLAWAPGGEPRVVFAFSISGGHIVEIELIADQSEFASSIW
jgi:RNA polymerase sigma-70 factor (ECF subfamily)